MLEHLSVLTLHINSAQKHLVHYSLTISNTHLECGHVPFILRWFYF